MTTGNGLKGPKGPAGIDHDQSHNCSLFTMFLKDKLGQLHTFLDNFLWRNERIWQIGEEMGTNRQFGLKLGGCNTFTGEEGGGGQK